MLALGVLLTCFALLGMASRRYSFDVAIRRAGRPAPGPGESVAIALVCVIALGMGYLGAGSIDAYQQGLEAVDLGLLAGVIASRLVVWRKLDLRKRLRAMAADETGPVTVPGAADGSPATMGKMPASTTEPPPSGPANRAA
jgi:hypothetical protein